MAALTFPNSPTDGQTVTIDGTTYIYRSAITAWDLLFNAPPFHGPSHGIEGNDPILIDQSQVSGLTAEIVQSSQYGAAGSVLQNLPHRILPAETKLKEAVFWIDSTHSASSGQEIKNLGWGGSALNPRTGSTISADTNDPKHLDYTGNSYVYVPGVAGNFLSVADSNELDIAGNIDIRVKLSLDNWSAPSGTQRIIGKYGAEGNRSYLLNFLSNRTLQFIWFSTSITQHIAGSGSAISLPDNTPKWVRVTVRVNNGSGGTNVDFYTSDDGVTWDALGSTVVIASITGFFNSTAPIQIGDISSTSSPMAGKIYNVEISNGIGGVPVLSIDTSHITSGNVNSFLALTSQTVTVNRSSTGRKTSTVCSPFWLLGTDDYLEVRERWMEYLGSNFAFIPGNTGNYLSVPDSNPLDIVGNIDLRAQVALDDWTPPTINTLLAKASTASTRSYKLSITTTGRIRLSWSVDGSTWIDRDSTVATGITNRGIKWVRATLAVNNGLGQNEVRFWISDDGFTWAQLGTTVVTTGVTSIHSSSSPVEIGTEQTGQVPMTGKVFVAQVLNEIEGATVLRVDVPANVAVIAGNVNSFTATTGQTVTVNRSGTDLRTAIVTYSGYLQPNSEVIIPANYSLLDFGSSESFTLFAVVRSFATQPTNARIISKEYISESDPNYELLWGNNGKPFGRISDSVVSATTANAGAGRSTYSYGNVGVIALVVNRSTLQMTEYLDGQSVHSTSMSTVGGLGNFGILRIGAHSYNTPTTNHADMELVSVAIFRKSLSASEIRQISNYYLGRVA
jgi:hypothetical protein